MLLAPKGAYRQGHAAFAIKVRGEANHWIYGSFGSTNDGPMAGWINGGTWQKARARFASVRDRDHNNARYYTVYRCVNTRDGDVAEAQAWYRSVKSRGYNLATNNCLHMTMAVFKGYSKILRRDRRLPSATGDRPNDYFQDILNDAHWEYSHRL